MQIIQNTPEKLVLRAEVNYSLANAIRRSVDEIPILAGDEVEIFKNDSALYDEVLAHRIGLVPLRNEKSMNEKTSVELKLVKTGPCTVYAKDFKGKAKVVHGGIPLTILEKGQELEIISRAKLGKGVEHAKYSPGLCYYKNILEIKSTPQIDNIIKNSKGTIKPEKKGIKWICDLNEADVDEILKIDKDSVKDSDEILIFIESWGQIDAKDILTKAIETLSNNLKEFEKAIK